MTLIEAFAQKVENVPRLRYIRALYYIQRTKLFPQPASNNWLSSLMLTVSGRKNNQRKHTHTQSTGEKYQSSRNRYRSFSGKAVSYHLCSNFLREA